MKIRSIVFDWYGDNASATPVVVVLEMPDDYEYKRVDDCHELWTAFLKMFGGDEGYDIDPEMCTSEYIYEVFAADVDMRTLKNASDVQWLHVKINN